MAETADEQARLSETLEWVLGRETMPEKGNGLFLVDMPTGYGKSHAAQNHLGAFVANPANTGRPIFYITPQKKNLPDDDAIERSFRRAGLGSPKPGQVLRVKPLHEMMPETADELVLGPVPERFEKMREFINLMSAAKIYRAATAARGPNGPGSLNMPGYESLAREKLTTAERAFRAAIVPALASPKGIAGSRERRLSRSERMSRLRRDPDWQWLGRLYPTAFTREASVLLMSLDKFLYPLPTLVEPPFRLIDSDFIHKAVVIVDEFDACKADMLDAIAEASVRTQADLVGLVRTTHSALVHKEVPKPIIKPCRRNVDRGQAGKPGELLARCRKVIEGAFADAGLTYEYKSRAGETSGDYIFYDFRYSSLIGDDYAVVPDDDARVNFIERRKGPDVPAEASLARRLGAMRGAVHYTQSIVRQLALNYYERLNDELADCGEYPLESAQRSVLDVFGFAPGPQRDFMLEGVRTRAPLGRGERDATQGDEAGDLSVYAKGFHLLSLADSEDHNETTLVRICSVQTTPEAELRRLMSKARVVGLSATASIDSVLCNFDLEYLRAQGENVSRVEGDELEKMRKSYDAQNAGYENVEVRASTISVDDKNPDWGEILGDEEAGNFAQDVAGEGAQGARYARLARAFKYFLSEPGIQSMLALTMAAPKEGACPLSVDVLKQLFDLVGKCLGVQDASSSLRTISGSSRFEADFEEIRRDLEAGDRVFLVAAYATMGTGVNIQYRACDAWPTVEVYSLEGSQERDFDAIYLDRPTNLAPWTRQMGEKELVKDLFEVCELRERGEISSATQTEAQGGLGKASLGAGKAHVPTFKDTRSFRGHATRYVNQGLGRICRTNRKPPVVHILADAGLASRMDLHAMDGRMVNREFQALLDALGYRAEPHEAQVAGELVEHAALISTRLNAELLTIVHKAVKSPSDMAFWNRLRMASLAKPTCREGEANALVTNTYVKAPRSITAYTYDQRGDFADVTVCLDGSQPLRREVSAKAARLDCLAKAPEVVELFGEKGWPLAWEPGEYLMSPTLFHNVYLGALGEQVGKRLLENRIAGLSLEQIEEGAAFEKFDFKVAGKGMSPDAYVDFKYWSAPSGQTEDEAGREVAAKMDSIGAKRAVICNVLGDASWGLRCRVLKVASGADEGERAILTVPLLLDEASGGVFAENVTVIGRFIKGGEQL